MCLAESLLRVPDALTANRLISDKITSGDWGAYLGQGDNWLLNASSWGLFLTGKFLNLGTMDEQQARRKLAATVRRVGEPVIRQSVKIAMQVMGRQFVLGEDLGQAFKKAKSWESEGYRYSYDMLGEGARTMDDADRYFAAYEDAIRKIGSAAKGMGPVEGPGISIKLSALHPRYQYSQQDRVQTEVYDRLMALAEMARDADINLTVDAEEADRLTMSLGLIERAMKDGGLKDWGGFGLAVQAYHKATPVVLNFIRDLAANNHRRMMVRLVKGAYWDFELKHAQEGGYEHYPVYTRKEATDVSYRACAAQLLDNRDWLYPQFATHNALSTTTILGLTKDHSGFEFQRLHGMGEHLYEGLREQGIYEGPVRIYAPVGEHEHLLAYLVRRLLENGANSSFVNKISDPDVAAESLLVDAEELYRSKETALHEKIELPKRILGTRDNSNGWNLETARDQQEAYSGLADVKPVFERLAQTDATGDDYDIVRPTDLTAPLATTKLMSKADCQAAANALDHGAWSALGSAARAEIITQVGELLETHKVELSALLMEEAGKLGADADAEVREAIDFCRYYAMDAQKSSGRLPQGKVLCISPWNFPLAIFLGQVAAALAAGNSVLAKPSEQAMLVAKRAVELCYEAGVPKEVLTLVPTDGRTAGDAFLADQSIAAIMFTGSTKTAQHIQSTVAARGGRLPVIIAETGGQNAMVVDSTALPEQVTDDVISSGFQSAGQRCSALRVLFLQEDIADDVITMIKGAMQELRIGDPRNPATDVGPVIDEAALNRLLEHEQYMKTNGKLHYKCELGEECQDGYFFAPSLYEIDNINVLRQEVFGPVVHVVRYRADEFDQVFDRINSTGFGLTMGIHSRIDSHVRKAIVKSHAGNIYVNRNIIGAVVGVQPFGGAGLSGTGPKAGGPSYLSRLLHTEALGEQDVSYSANGANEAFEGEWLELALEKRWELIHDVLGASLANYEWARVELGECTVLPGPTGEANFLELRSRGSVWIDPNVMDAQAESLLALALLAGNEVGIAVTATYAAKWRPLVEAGAISLRALSSEADHLALLASGEYTTLVMAPNEQMIAATAQVTQALPIVVDSGDEHLALQRFCHEVTVSENTTAAGGNAALMADID